MPAKPQKAALEVLKKAVEHYFGDEYLFERENAYFRNRVSPEKDDDDDEEKEKKDSKEPPAIPCASLLHFPEIQKALAALAPATTITTKNASQVSVEDAHKQEEQAHVKLIADAVKHSTLVLAASSSSSSSSASEGTGKNAEKGVAPSSAEEAVVYTIRRRAFLNPADDPAHRTVVARPLPTAATLDDLREFFAPLTVESVKTIRQNAKVAASAAAATSAASASSLAAVGGGVGDALQRRVNPYWCAFRIRFATVQEAEEAIARCNDSSKHSVGEGPARKKTKREKSQEEEEEAEEERSDALRPAHFGATAYRLAQKFFPPRLYVSSLAEYEGSQRQQRRELDEKQLRLNILRAQTALTQLNSQRSSNSKNMKSVSEGVNEKECGDAQAVTHFLRKGVTLVVDAVPVGVSWAAIKAGLGGLSSENEAVKKCIQLVQIDEHTALSGSAAAKDARKAFIVCKTPESAKELLLVFQLSDAKTRPAAAPSLRAATEAEELYAQQQFPSWCAPRVSCKRQLNRRYVKH